VYSPSVGILASYLTGTSRSIPPPLEVVMTTHDFHVDTKRPPTIAPPLLFPRSSWLSTSNLMLNVAALLHMQAMQYTPSSRVYVQNNSARPPPPPTYITPVDLAGMHAFAGDNDGRSSKHTVSANDDCDERDDEGDGFDLPTPTYKPPVLL
jgi:hypothetical protein